MAVCKVSCLLLALLLVGTQTIRSDNVGNVILDWNDIALRAMAGNLRETSHTSRMLVMIHVAMWNAMANEKSSSVGLTTAELPGDTDGDHPARASILEFSACVAAHNILISFFPDLQPVFDLALRKSRDASKVKPIHESIAIAIGKATAVSLMSERLDDGSQYFIDYTITKEAPHWQPVPPDYNTIPTTPQWPFVRSFSGFPREVFRVPPFPAMTSKEYAVAVNHTMVYGSKKGSLRADYDTKTAHFWADRKKGWDRPVGHWNRIVGDICKGTKMSVQDTAKLLRVLNIALADASVGKAVNKYRYDHWRPVTCIREGTHGNPDIPTDPEWHPLVKTENSQEYPSGHGAWAGAAGRVLQRWFQTDRFKFDVANKKGTIRTYERFSDAVNEVLQSRIFAGNHFSFSVQAGRLVGQMAADAAWVACGLPVEQIDGKDVPLLVGQTSEEPVGPKAGLTFA